MMFVGIYRPFILPIHNNLELANEILILFNSYFLLIFSDMVLDLHARYFMGWLNLGVIITLIIVNLSIITVTTGANTCHSLKMMYLKRKYAKYLM